MNDEPTQPLTGQSTDSLAARFAEIAERATRSDEYWDAVFAVRYPNRSAFIAMVTDPEYQAITHYRTASPADSRLILTEIGD